MIVGSVLSLITNRGKHKGIISGVKEQDNMIFYKGYIDGQHYFEIVYVKESNHYSGSVSWSNNVIKNLPYNASYIENFSQEAC